jgi:uncharacterized phage protein (predicted DNA packaging)
VKQVINEVTKQAFKDYARIDYDDDDSLIDSILLAAKAYIKSYTGLNEEQVNGKEDLTIAFMVLCREMYITRQYMVDKDKVNVVIKTILDMHSVNLL